MGRIDLEGGVGDGKTDEAPERDFGQRETFACHEGPVRELSVDPFRAVAGEGGHACCGLGQAAHPLA